MWPLARGRVRAASRADAARGRAPEQSRAARTVLATRAAPPSAFLQQHAQSSLCAELADALDIDTLAVAATHTAGTLGDGQILRGLLATESVRGSTALVTVPLTATLAVRVGPDGGGLTVVAPPDLPPNVKKAIEAVAGLIQETPGHHLAILALLLLYVRKNGSPAWRSYCADVLPLQHELSCLLCYAPGDLGALQLPHLRVEAGRQHDWARWFHSQWASASSGALRRLQLAASLEDSAWALANVRSRAIEFPLGLGAAPPPSASALLQPGGGAAGAPAPAAGPALVVLAPLLDLANHSADPNCVVQLSTDGSRVVLLPRRPVAAGEPLTLDYGAGCERTPVEWMCDYGFVPGPSPHDGDVLLPGADKLPPLDVQRLQAAAQALQRRRGGGVIQVEGEGAEDEGEDADDAGDGGGAPAAGTGTDDARLRAAVALLAPRTSLRSPIGASGFSTPATQRVIAGLWHKQVQHCAASLPTSLEADLVALADIEAGRASGLLVGPALRLDPAPEALPEAGARDASPGRGGPPETAPRALQGAAAPAQAAGVGDAGMTVEGEGAGGVGRAQSAAEERGGAEAAGLRSGPLAGRLYAALRARVEHKRLLLVAEELLLQYARM